MVPSSLPDPTRVACALGMSAPCRDATCGDTDDAALAQGPRLELRMAQQTSNVVGDLQRPNINVDQTNAVVAKRLVEEVAVSTNQQRAAQFSQQQDDLVVLHSLATDITSDLAEVNAPLAQACALTLEDVFIENAHTEAGLSR